MIQMLILESPKDSSRIETDPAVSKLKKFQSVREDSLALLLANSQKKPFLPNEYPTEGYVSFTKFIGCQHSL